MGYTEIYKKVYEAMKNDFIPNEKLNISARKVTDAIWDIQLEIDHGSKYPNT